MRWLALGGVGVLTVVVIGVGFLVRSCAADKEDAERAVADLYEALDRDDYDAALAIYHPESWFRLSEAQMLAQIQAIDEDLGRREEGRLVGWNVQKGSQSWVDLTYENLYEKGVVVEAFRLVRLDGVYKILVHN